jgi:hypothetical protein
VKIARNLIIACLLCNLFVGCSLSQSNPSKSTAWPSVIPVEPSEASVQGGRFQSPSGRFQIDIPEMPVQTLDMGSEKGRIKGVDAGKAYIWKFESTLYTVMYRPPVNPDGDPASPVFDDMVIGSRKGALRQNAKIISEKPFKSGDFEGTELRYVSPDGANFINRLFIFDNIGYQVVGSYRAGGEKEILSVLDSFKVLPKKQ